MGVGAMIGAGIFALLGQVATLAGALTPWVFALAAFISLLSAYSYARLGVRYPSSGGVAEYLVRAYGAGFVAGWTTVLLYLAMVVGMSLVAGAFGAYGNALLPGDGSPLRARILTAGVVILLLLINASGSDAVGRSERIIVTLKVLLLAVFVIVGISFAKGPEEPHRVPMHIAPLAHALALCLFAYQGFGVITNTAGEMPNPTRTLPMAIFLAVTIVMMVYVGVAVATLANLSIEEIRRTREYALAEAARPIFGAAGSTIVSLTAMISAASCINASLYSSANMTYLMATARELSAIESRRVWRGGTVGLFTTGALVLICALLLDLSSIAVLASLSFLVVYVVVHAGHLGFLVSETGASRIILVLALLTNAVALLFFAASTFLQSPRLAIVLACMLILAATLELIAHRVRGPLRVDKGIPGGSFPGD